MILILVCPTMDIPPQLRTLVPLSVISLGGSWSGLRLRLRPVRCDSRHSCTGKDISWLPSSSKVLRFLLVHSSMTAGIIVSLAWVSLWMGAKPWSGCSSNPAILNSSNLRKMNLEGSLICSPPNTGSGTINQLLVSSLERQNQTGQRPFLAMGRLLSMLDINAILMGSITLIILSYEISTLAVAR